MSNAPAAEDEGAIQSSTAFSADPIENLAALGFVLGQIHQHYTNFGLPPPPLPTDVAAFPPAPSLLLSNTTS
jgi:hypothetical protein